MDKDIKDLKVLYSASSLQERVKELGNEINNAFSQNETLYILCVLKGGVMFCTDLIKHLKMPVQLEFIKLSSYGNEQKSSGKVTALNITLPDLKDKQVLIVEDIVDTGLTAKFLMSYVKTCEPKELKLISLLNKECARVEDVKLDYYGFMADEKFVVGYGLDYQGYFRNLDYVGYFPE